MYTFFLHFNDPYFSSQSAILGYTNNSENITVCVLYFHPSISCSKSDTLYDAYGEITSLSSNLIITQEENMDLECEI